MIVLMEGGTEGWTGGQGAVGWKEVQMDRWRADVGRRYRQIHGLAVCTCKSDLTYEECDRQTDRADSDLTCDTV